LSGIQDDGAGGLVIGALTTWAQIAEADLPAPLACLRQAAGQVGGRQVQNAGTIGGNLCNASPAADGVPPLLALDAVVELTGPGGTRRLALADFLKGPRRTARAADEVLTAIRIPGAALAGRSAFEKLGARAYLVISIAMVAVRVTARDGQAAQVALAVGACGPVACRLPRAEAALTGLPLADLGRAARALDLTDALAPLDDIRASAAYRRAAVPELLARALERCA
jgi:CO/xanthine dehydrogenase FAD-binding subunit